MINKKVYIFTEGGKNIGFGHIIRCSELYNILEKNSYNPIFIINGLGIKDILKNKNYINIDWLNFCELKKFNITKNDIIIIDSYLASYKIYEYLAKISKKVLIIDDNNRINYPDLKNTYITNPSLMGNEIKYPNAKNIKYLLGAKYIILRKEFLNTNNKQQEKKDFKSITITMGGTDLNNYTPKILKKIAAYYPKNTNIYVIFSQNFTNLKEIKKYTTNKTYFLSNLSAIEIKKLFLNSDLVISACGQTIHELLFLQIPFIPIITANNQIKNKESLTKLGIEVYKKPEDIKFSNTVYKHFKIKHLIDGLGAKRIINHL